MLQISKVKPAFVSIGMSLVLCVACGSSDGAQGNAGGSSSASGGSSNSGGGSSSGGSGTPGGSHSAGGSGPSAGGAASASSGSFSSGLPSDKQLGSLTDAEKAAICQKLSDYFSQPAVSKSFEEFTCRSSSVVFALALSGAETDSELQIACKGLYDQCVAGPLMTSETCQVSEGTSGCSATVAEYDACMNDYTKALDQLIAEFPSCDKLTMASSLQPSTQSAPASCQSLKAKCPNLSLPGQGE